MENKNQATTTTCTSVYQERALEMTTQLLKQNRARRVKKEQKSKPKPHIPAQTSHSKSAHNLQPKIAPGSATKAFQRE